MPIRLGLSLSLVVVVAAGAGCVHANASQGEKGGFVALDVGAKHEALNAAWAGHKYAVVVGITSGGDDRWRPLRFARKDADDLAAVLQDPLRGHFARVDELTSPEATTKAAILAAAEALARRATRTEDLLLFYVSAHGTLARDDTGTLRRYLVTSDALMSDVAHTALSMEALEKALEATGSRRRVLVLATCHSGGGKSLLPPDVSDELATLKGAWVERPLEETSRANLVLSASDFGETAREDEQLQNDVYTHFLVEALDGSADRNADGAVTATEAHDYARRRTWVFSHGRQRPSAELLEVGADPLVLVGSIRRVGQPELYSYAPHLDGVTIRVDGEARGELPGGVALAAGPHTVELTKGGLVLAQSALELSAGDRVDLDTVALSAEPSHAISLLGGVVGFLNQARRNDVFAPTATVGVAARFDRVGLKALSVELDVAGFSGPQRLVLTGQAPVPFTGTTVVGGASALYNWSFREFSVLAGPRVAALWLQRSFSTDVYRQAQSAFSVTPGVSVGVVWHFARSFEAAVMAQALVSLLTLEGRLQALGFAGGWASVGYRF